MPDIYYIAGPMRGYPENNFPAFAQRARELRAENKIVISPHELGGEGQPGRDWPWFLRRDLKMLTDCTHIVMLDGWEKSDGAQLEHEVAYRLGLVRIYPDGTWGQSTVPSLDELPGIAERMTNFVEKLTDAGDRQS